MTQYWILMFAIIVMFALLGEWGIVKMAYRLKLFDKPNNRKIHSAQIPRLGGLIILPTMLVGLAILLLCSPSLFFDMFNSCDIEVLGVFLAIAVVYSCGLIDDLVGLRYRNKFAAEIVAGVALCSCGIVVDDLHGFLMIGELPKPIAWIFTIFSVIFITNAINFIDGIDGLAGSLSVVAATYYAWFFGLSGNSGYTWLSLLVIIPVMALLMFNLLGTSKSRTKVFMGDSGSLTLGVILCALGILLTRHVQLPQCHHFNAFVIALIPLMLPCADVVRVVFYRQMHGKNIFEADKSHIHHKLLAAGLSQRGSLLVILAIELVIVATALLVTCNVNATLAILLEVALFSMAIALINRKIKQ